MFEARLCNVVVVFQYFHGWCFEKDENDVWKNVCVQMVKNSVVGLLAMFIFAGGLVLVNS